MKPWFNLAILNRFAGINFLIGCLIRVLEYKVCSSGAIRFVISDQGEDYLYSFIKKR